MDDQQLDRTLWSIGKACFVNYFREFSDCKLSAETVADILAKREGWDHHAALHFRTRGARRIIQAGRAKDALTLIANSPRMPASVKSRALTLVEGMSP